MLYLDTNNAAGIQQAQILIWNRPARRWAQFGSLAELRALAAEHGVTYRSGAGREQIIRAIWSKRWPRDILPGAVGPYTSSDLHDRMPTNAEELNRTEQSDRPIGTPRRGPLPTYGDEASS